MFLHTFYPLLPQGWRPSKQLVVVVLAAHTHVLAGCEAVSSEQRAMIGPLPAPARLSLGCTSCSRLQQAAPAVRSSSSRPLQSVLACWCVHMCVHTVGCFVEEVSTLNNVVTLSKLFAPF